MFINNINPVLLSLGPFEIRFYGLVYIIGFLLGYYALYKLIKHKNLNITFEELDSYFIWLIIGSMLMSRTFEVFIYNYQSYAGHLIDFFKIWNGGLSIQGGLLGAILVTLIFCYKINKQKKRITFYEIADPLIIITAFTLAIGKIANYINSELYGTIVNSQAIPWCVVFEKVDSYCRHPVQIYEFLLYIILFATLAIYYLKHSKITSIKKTDKDSKYRNGPVFWMFIIGFSIIRFSITFLRDEPKSYLVGIGLNSGQWISLVTIILSSIILVWLWKSKSKSI